MIKEERMNQLLVPIESDDGNQEAYTKLDFDEKLGRIVVATKATETTGHVIIREMPLLVWPSDDWNAYLNLFVEAGEETKEIILDMYTPPDSSSLMKKARALALTLSFPGLLPETVEKLIGVSNTNAHEYYGTETDDFYETIQIASRVSSGRSALFAYGSKVPHSCLPNVTYSSKTKEGFLEYKVIRPIKEGEIVSFSYTDKLFAAPTHERRQQLLDTKEFFCQCKRCIGPDFCRVHPCPRCKGFIACTVVNQDDPPIWTCETCGIHEKANDSLVAKEVKLARDLQVWDLKCSLPGGVTNVHPNEVRDVLRAIQRDLPARHFLTLRAFESQVRILASHAAGIEQAQEMGFLPPGNVPTPFGRPHTLRRQAAEMATIYVTGCECNAAECLNPKCRGGHPPVYECATEVFHASQDLKKIPKTAWPSETVSMICRYIPMMKISFGSKDNDVLEVESIFARTNSVVTNSIEVARVVTKTNNSTASAKKKGGGRPNNKKKKKNRKK